MAGATSTASPYCVALRGAPGSGCGLYQGELGPEAHERNTPFLCNRASRCVPEAPLKGPLHIFPRASRLGLQNPPIPARPAPFCLSTFFKERKNL